MAEDLTQAWRRATTDLIARTRAIQPDHLPVAVDGALAPLGVVGTIYLVDYEQLRLHPFPPADRAPGGSVPIEGTAAGRVFAEVRPRMEGNRLWYPLLDGSERLGVLALDGTTGVLVDPDALGVADGFAGLLGHLVSVLGVYGDGFAQVRRTRPMSVGAELLWRLLPPLTYVSDRFVVSAILEPVYSVGGDAFDYGVHRDKLSLVVLDAAGHGLRAGLAASVALSAIRAARLAEADLTGLVAAADAALREEFVDHRFATAVIAELDLDTGVLQYVNAGHPPPLLIRDGGIVARLDQAGRMPLGVPDSAIPGPAMVRMELGDRLLIYTDGVIEAHGTDGEQFGVERLTVVATDHAARGLPAPETLRRLSHDVLGRYDGPPTDDATLLLVEWSRRAVARSLP